MATGDLVLMTVQDARPRNSSWISNMVQALESNGLDGVCGKAGRASAMRTRTQCNGTGQSMSQAKTIFLSKASVEDASPQKK